MLVGFLLLLSGLLIGAGFALVLRDWVQKKRLSFLPRQPAQGRAAVAEEAEITIARTNSLRTEVDAAAPTSISQSSASDDVVTTAFRELPSFEARCVEPIAPAFAPRPPTKPADVAPMQIEEMETEGPVHQETEAALPTQVIRVTSWSSVRSRVLRALERAQARSSSEGLEIITAGQPLDAEAEEDAPGATFPIRLAGREAGRLSVELDLDGDLSARLTMPGEHAPAESQLYRRLAPDRQADADIDQLVAECLAPVLARAAAATTRPRVRVAANIERSPLLAPPAAEPEAEAVSERAWLETAPTLSAALRAMNGAFAQVATRLIEIGKPQWDEVHLRHRQTLALVVEGEDAARVHVERLAHEFEISVASIDSDGGAGGREIGRRRRVPTDGITVQALAELIAACVWPTIARIRGRSTSARPT